MKRPELRTKLDELGIDPRLYALTGGMPPEKYVLRRAWCSWAIYYTERGKQLSYRSFATEDQACEAFYIWLKEELHDRSYTIKR